ncbi:intermediate filament protein ON3-like [Lampris incognitus]|uniref:intermediate filament protein ON3-like n=1 Tax=Lampris incognitus TaxID=2546036 RepID=UPI0024B4F11F|nr:intermediate filament protein ON3-like [Lampris incognitus]
MSKPGGYSSQSYSPAGRAAAPRSAAPTTAKLDPNDQCAKTKEKDQMVGLNDRFVAFIEKVKHLEDQNKVLDTRLKILQDQENYKGKIDEVVQQLEMELQRQVDNLERDRAKLQADLLKSQEDVEQTKLKYEDEFLKKSDLENEFIVTKKDVDEGHLATVDLALELEDLMGELEFLRRGYEEEIKELESQVQNETVIMRDTSKRALDMDEIIESVKVQYNNMATRTREEANQWNQKKMDDLMLSAGKHEQDVRDMKKEIADLLRLIQRLNGELESLKKKKESAEKDIKDMEIDAQENMEQARENIGQLEEALRRAKQDMTRQVREYQVLMNLKLALDIEIATYRKLLEGEEKRMNDHMRSSDVDSPSKQQPPVKPFLREPIVMATIPISKKRLLIRVEVEAGKVVSQSSQYADD